MRGWNLHVEKWHHDFFFRFSIWIENSKGFFKVQASLEISLVQSWLWSEQPKQGSIILVCGWFAEMLDNTSPKRPTRMPQLLRRLYCLQVTVALQTFSRTFPRSNSSDGTRVPQFQVRPAQLPLIPIVCKQCKCTKRRSRKSRDRFCSNVAWMQNVQRCQTRSLTFWHVES